jgi:hypothetical protein
MSKYDLHVQLQPEIRNGALAHPWRLTISYADGTFDIANGFAPRPGKAASDALDEARKRGLVK